MPRNRQILLIKQALLAAVGVVCAFIGLNWFLVPNALIDGGVTGVAMLAARATGIPLPFLLVIINSPFVFWGWRKLGKNFGVACIFSICSLAVALKLGPSVYVTSDHTLAAIFGGVFIGAGMGLTIRGGAVLDGTEILALFLERILPFSIGDFVLAVNIAIFLVAAAMLGVEPALYSMITYWSAARTADFILTGIEEYNGIFVVSEKSDIIRSEILGSFRRGITVIPVRGGKNAEPMEMLFCVITRLELPKLRRLIHDLDERAFFVSYRLGDAQGGLTSRSLISGINW